MARRASSTKSLGVDLRIGDLVEVRSESEILATLDERGEFDGLPLMPEMLQFCGQRFRVDKLAIKLCDTISHKGMRRMLGAVHLEAVRCDGGAHGGCQAECLIYWKETWLKRVDEPVPNAAVTGYGYDRGRLIEATRKNSGVSGDEVFSCQATELLRAAPDPLPWWDGRAYARDLRSGNVGVLAMIRSLLFLLFNKSLGLTRRYLPRRLWLLGEKRYPRVDGRLTKTPKGEQLDLKAGEMVEIRSWDEIRATLDVGAKNRGLVFDREMIKYCGRTARVRSRAERIIDEPTGKMLRLKDCIILDEVVCAGDYNQYCPRGIFAFWRETWLKRVDAHGPDVVGTAACPAQSPAATPPVRGDR